MMKESDVEIFVHHSNCWKLQANTMVKLQRNLSVAKSSPNQVNPLSLDNLDTAIA